MNAFDEENFKLAVRLLSQYKLDVNKAEIVCEMLEFYPEHKINRWLAKIASSSNPDREFDNLLVVDEPSLIKPERMSSYPHTGGVFNMGQYSCGVKDHSGIAGRYSLAIDFKQIYDDPNVFYGTWEETPPARRRFR
jgi:hypothetical protein